MTMLDNIYKRDVINFLFVISFPLYGIGLYLAATLTPSVGYLFGSMPYAAVLVFYVVDVLYKREFHIKINGNYFISILFYASVVAAFLVALNKHLPGSELSMLMIRSAFIIIPFHAFIIVSIYNEGNDCVMQLTLRGLTLLLVINLAGYYGLGMSNEVHHIEGRINFPFLDGLYSGACLLAIINLMLFYQIRNSGFDRLPKGMLLGYFIINLVFIFYINSRLVTLVLLLVIILMLFNVRKMFKGVFTFSLFTLPLLLSGGMLIYEILSLPVFQVIMQRVDLLDVMTFHGRSFIWQTGVDWMTIDQRGLIFGNGYKGHYFLDLLGDIAKLFDIRQLQDLHLHSTTLEIVVNQGLIGLGLFFTVLYKSYRYYRGKYRLGASEGAFFPVVLFVLFVCQVDSFVYLDNLGGLLFAFLAARICLRQQPETARPPFSVLVVNDNGKLISV
jgi:hypothetical protein